ncbi:DmsE family decaheme c-type cytochrome [Bradyrhizobium sp.]|uniref:DmsE family decaheme c-type cytochrome n=1 Tax=Bradyrhizobium sp. TaxID=376 RepID=UPI0025C215D0|nr:DmsE family decaheme c-type cytochrome [Bradyrhizobium sp.]
MLAELRTSKHAAYRISRAALVGFASLTILGLGGSFDFGAVKGAPAKNESATSQPAAAPDDSAQQAISELAKWLDGGATSPHGANPHAANPHAANPHGKNPHGAKPHGAANPHGANPHASLGDRSERKALVDFVRTLNEKSAGLDAPKIVAPKLDAKIVAPKIVLAENAPAKSASKPRAAAASAAGARAPMVAPAPDDPLGRYYVGSKPCETCHAGLFDEFQETVMGRNIKSGKMTPQGKMECETCHGPGSKHVNEGGGRNEPSITRIRSFRKTDPARETADVNGVCLSCHEKGNQTYWQGSAHQNRDVACVDCHTVMRKTTPRNQLARNTVMDTCFQCHKDRRAQTYRTSHMPIREGKINCASCHNPHGSPTEKLLKEASINETCYNCHADKRGPFLYEHAPVRENCLNCHDAHGTMHDNSLVVMRERLCQRCHSPHGAAGAGPLSGNNAFIATQNRYAVGQSCQNCHTNIHGSNSPSGSRFHR